MAGPNSLPSIDPKSGFCFETKTFHSIRPAVPLPPPTLSLSIADYALSLFRNSSSPGTTALIDSDTGRRLTYAEFIRQIENLAASLQTQIGLCRGDTAFILSPACLEVPILYFSLFSLGVVIAPTNPTSTSSEISRQIKLCKPVIAFAASATAHKLPSLRHETILLDSPEFDSMLTAGPAAEARSRFQRVEVNQSDPAANLFSSGTTGPVKAVLLTHRNWISMVAGIYSLRPQRASPAVLLSTVSYFHVYGLLYCVKSVAVGETVVVMRKFDLGKMRRAVEQFRVTHMAVAPPVVVAMVKDNVVMKGCDMSSLEAIMCSGAPFAEEVAQRFTERFPGVFVAQAYGLTETTGGVFRSVGPGEKGPLGSSGRLASNCEAKIVDPYTGNVMPPCKQGELWIRGPTVMKGYIDNDEATAATLDPEGWLRSGDICYIDNNGFIFVVDRLKDLIKYKGYQVAPAELENLLQSHPDIIDAAVIPYPDEEAGQVPMAFVVRRPQSTIDELQIMEFIARQVAPYNKVRRVSFIDSIPKNATGKTLRKELVKLALSATVSKL
ncbi:4-coumarate--CoA ligase-like 9 [Macadamia integrifolia]|uniref:4-coumarate--CoA ligase-like 9 n=1 Tax=Macadamia integrifolia TaxID=60698 RepID=UPI001C4E8FC9|nr:4-coumarate--CoA ligase-like 9 [Macadamia integrifolia]